jgi:iron complex outermembrane receptor protein
MTIRSQKRALRTAGLSASVSALAIMLGAASVADAQGVPVDASKASRIGDAPVRLPAPAPTVGADTPNSTDVGSTPEQAEAASRPADASTQTGVDTVRNAATDEVTADIIVTGFRGSIQSSLNEKRQSDQQIDAINAEDIADFPDANLAESLQRLPGVSIDRDNGEGRGITVRGLGGDFNRTRLNGLEALSTAGSNDAGTSPNRSRSFDYNTFASELFSSLKVQKTPSAETDEGSLGATVDLVTGKPFDYKGTRFALSTEASYNENSKKTNPRLAGLVSTRFGSGKSMGLLLSAAYNKTDNVIDQYSRSPGQSDYLYRSSQFLGEGSPQRAGFSAPVGTALPYANPDALAAQTGSDPVAYAKLYPGAPYNTLPSPYSGTSIADQPAREE